MPKTFSNNAAPKYLGYVYQVLIAIEQCFQAKNNQTIYIECFGDIYNGETSTEVKHHFGKANLTNNSEDFWKTLKNLVTEDVSEINAFILHTTADIPGNSIFFGWNELSNTEKYDRLKKHTPRKTIKPYYDVVIAKPKEELLPILEKLTIKSSQPNIKDKWEELKEAKIFTLIDDKYREDAFHWVYGYVNRQAVDDRNNWHIKINDFNSACRLALSKYTQDKIPFEYVEESEVHCDFKGLLFVNEMKNIKLKDNPIEQAVSDYFRANTNQLNLLKKHPATMAEILDKYDNSILRSIQQLKNECSSDIQHEDLNTNTVFKVARNLYFSCMKLELITIPQVSDTQKYYQDGRIHHNVNEGKFFWRFCEDDLQ